MKLVQQQYEFIVRRGYNMCIRTPQAPAEFQFIRKSIKIVELAVGGGLMK